MPTRLSRYAEGVMEAAWLAAVVVVPLFFNVYSSRIFEPDKIALLRSIALVLLAAWLVRIFENGLQADGDEGPRWKAFIKTPIVLPVLSLAAVYLLATLLSVVPEISFFGSYQRLQGTYSTLSYLVIFGGLAANLRRRAQVERLITTLVLVSLPVSFYGLLQRNGLDPVPWAGNVSRRIASNMGNAIFVAAYLIMVVPLTIGRLIQAYRDILDEGRENVVAPFARATIYFIILLFQLVAIYLSRSRGPVLGLLAGLFFLFLVIIIYSRIRWLTYTFIGLAAVLSIFLVTLNVEHGPLESLRASEWVGRFGHIFDSEQATNRVRVLIWEGAVDLVAPHEPLSYPDGTSDAFNAIRPLVGYGPESMHVAYNRFYPPELGSLEDRNASPDRSHNETWDTLVTTGFFGLIAYLTLFASIFYYGLKWLRLISSGRDRNLFVGLFVAGSVLSAVGFYLSLGVEYLGVGIPFGAIVGLILYLAIHAIISPSDGYRSEDEMAQHLTILILLAGLVGHFVEINFGIAIVSTRTYFWVYTGLILAVGYFLPRLGEYVLSPDQDAEEAAGIRSVRKRGKKSSRPGTVGKTPARVFLAEGAILALVLGTLGYDFINAQNQLANPFSTVWASFTQVPNQGPSIWVLALVLLIWLLAGLIFTAEHSEGVRFLDWKGLGILLGVSLTAAAIFWLWHANGLISVAISAGQQQPIVTQAGLFEGLLTRYYLFLLAFILVAARLLPGDWPKKSTAHPTIGWVVASLALIGAVVLAVFSNLQVIQADITFKLSDPLTRNGQYEAGIELLERTGDLSYGLDHYSLFLGKAYLEYAGQTQDPEVEEARVRQAEESLIKAQEANPLNTDHTANLARLYRWWAGRTQDQVSREERAQISADYYSGALELSPNNAALWGEWGSLYMTLLGDFEQTFEKLSAGEEVDPQFDGIHALLGDYYTNLSRQMEDGPAKEEAQRNAIAHYAEAISLLKPNARKARLPRYNYRLAMAIVYSELGEYDEALLVYQDALDEAPNNVDVWRVHEAIAVIHLRQGDQDLALRSATSALALAPPGQQDRLQELIASIQP
ncbi:MAG: O-antigen ligase family protein [Anaerolineales bacterium]|nr:O-antigen ligase family protein [Anaerolineales bacterium]